MNIYDSELAALLGAQPEADEMASPRGSQMQVVECDCQDCDQTYTRYWYPWKRFINYGRCAACAFAKWTQEQAQTLSDRVLH